MKKIFVILTIVSCIFAGAVEASQQRNRIRKQLVAQNERQILLDNCWKIRSNIAEQFAAMGALHSSGFRNAVKQGITNYLNSVGTPTARQLLSELQANDFKGYI